MNKGVVFAVCLLFAGYSGLVGTGDRKPGVEIVAYQLSSQVSAFDSTVQTEANQSRFSSGARSEYIAIDDDTIKCALIGTACCSVLVVMPILLGCLLPTYTQHVRNTTTYDLSISCIGSVNTLGSKGHGRLHCSSKPTVNTLCASAPWHSTIKNGCATGHDIKLTDTFELSVTPCKRDCSSTSQSCSGSGNNKHCSQRTTFYDNTVTWTPIYSLRGWNGSDSEYITNVESKNLSRSK